MDAPIVSVGKIDVVIPVGKIDVVIPVGKIDVVIPVGEIDVGRLLCLKRCVRYLL